MILSQSYMIVKNSLKHSVSITNHCFILIYTFLNALNKKQGSKSKKSERGRFYVWSRNMDIILGKLFSFESLRNVMIWSWKSERNDQLWKVRLLWAPSSHFETTTLRKTTMTVISCKYSQYHSLSSSDDARCPKKRIRIESLITR